MAGKEGSTGAEVTGAGAEGAGGPETEPIPPTAGGLSASELCARRKNRLSELVALYKEQFWVVAEELGERARELRSAEGVGAPGASGQEFEGTPGGLAEHYGDKLPSASDVEEDVLAGKARVAPNAEARGRRRAEAALRIPAIRGLERTAVSIFSRRASSRGALACLVGKRAAFYLSRPEMSIGRSTKYQIVDVDLSPEGDCSKVSRQQGMVRLHPGGSFYFQNLGQRKAKVDGNAVPTRARAVLKNGSLLQVGGLSLMFLVNPLRRD